MKLICPDCGSQYDTGKFCMQCGGKLQEVVPELVCPSCGYKAKSGKFCPECGTKLTEQFASPTTVQSDQSVERKFNEKDERFAKYYGCGGDKVNKKKKKRLLKEVSLIYLRKSKKYQN